MKSIRFDLNSNLHWNSIGVGRVHTSSGMALSIESHKASFPTTLGKPHRESFMPSWQRRKPQVNKVVGQCKHNPAIKNAYFLDYIILGFQNVKCAKCARLLGNESNLGSWCPTLKMHRDQLSVAFEQKIEICSRNTIDWNRLAHWNALNPFDFECHLAFFHHALTGVGYWIRGPKTK